MVSVPNAFFPNRFGIGMTSFRISSIVSVFGVSNVFGRESELEGGQSSGDFSGTSGVSGKGK